MRHKDHCNNYCGRSYKLALIQAHQAFWLSEVVSLDSLIRHLAIQNGEQAWVSTRCKGLAVCQVLSPAGSPSLISEDLKTVQRGDLDGI
jgi:hypothetical protein